MKLRNNKKILLFKKKNKNYRLEKKKKKKKKRKKQKDGNVRYISHVRDVEIKERELTQKINIRR